MSEKKFWIVAGWQFPMKLKSADNTHNAAPPPQLPPFFCAKEAGVPPL